jgi:hypothetical protein
VALAGAGRADEMQDLGAIDEAEFGERHDAVLVERGLEGEVEAGERFDGGQARHDERRFHATGLAQGELLSEQGVDGFKRGHLAAFEATQGGVEDLDGARHFEADHGLLDALDQRWNDLGTGVHRVPP